MTGEVINLSSQVLSDDECIQESQEALQAVAALDLDPEVSQKVQRALKVLQDRQDAMDAHLVAMFEDSDPHGCREWDHAVG
jgi:hypothetical protein